MYRNNTLFKKCGEEKYLLSVSALTIQYIFNFGFICLSILAEPLLRHELVNTQPLTTLNQMRYDVINNDNLRYNGIYCSTFLKHKHFSYLVIMCGM